MRFAKLKNGNYTLLLGQNGTKIRLPTDDNKPYNPKVPESVDMKIWSYCNVGCPWCHENSLRCDDPFAAKDEYKKILNNFDKLFETESTPFEIALGGGGLLSCKQINSLIYYIKTSAVHYGTTNALNMTVNSMELVPEEKMTLLKSLMMDQGINAVGVSYNPNDICKKRIDEVNCLNPNMVVHTIFGITTMEDYRYLMKQHYRILILGYKEFRRGLQYYQGHSEKIKKNQQEIINSIDEILNYDGVVSFDELATKQLDLKNRIPEEVWDREYLGGDGKFTMFIDATTGTFATSSTTPIEKRHEIGDMNFEQIFDVIKNENKGE